MPVKPDPLISDMQIIGKALRSKSKSDKSSERTSTKTSRISIREVLNLSNENHITFLRLVSLEFYSIFAH